MPDPVCSRLSCLSGQRRHSEPTDHGKTNRREEQHEIMDSHDISLEYVTIKKGKSAAVFLFVCVSVASEGGHDEVDKLDGLAAVEAVRDAIDGVELTTIVYEADHLEQLNRFKEHGHARLEGVVLLFDSVVFLVGGVLGRVVDVQSDGLQAGLEAGRIRVLVVLLEPIDPVDDLVLFALLGNFVLLLFLVNLLALGVRSSESLLPLPLEQLLLPLLLLLMLILFPLDFV
mmetsp:Transcript_40082/g.100306  ORF Transcript_40082/g.100306 Transcript_40082/m.100306 type:complete len:229 (-) Transcript_40082:818-1504(-)